MALVQRRRERRLRSWLRHERQSVAMELAAALHHSRDARSDVAHEALRGQKTASSGSRPAPLEEILSVPLLAGRDGIDNTVRWLLKLAQDAAEGGGGGGGEEGTGCGDEEEGAGSLADPRHQGGEGVSGTPGV